MGAQSRVDARFPSGQLVLTLRVGNRDPGAMVRKPDDDDDRCMTSDANHVVEPDATDPVGAATAADVWVEGVDVFEHHCISFATARAQGTEVAIVRAGRGTRQDSRWIEHVRSGYHTGFSLASYWHLYPSRTDPHHQAELWAAAICSADVPFGYGHWADISTTDGFERGDLGRYVAAFLRRADELLGAQVGVFAPPGFWWRHVGFDDPLRPRWADAATGAVHDTSDVAFAGIRLSACDRGGAGRHRVRRAAQGERAAALPQLVQRGTTESVEEWRSRWSRTPEIAVLQMQLNDLGARLVVDGVFGPQTDAAVRTCDLLCRRDRLVWPFGTAPAHSATVC